MNTDVKFAIWCVRKCLHLWDAPEEVTSWLTDPKPELAAEAAEAAEAAWAATRAAEAARAAAAAAWAAEAAEAAEAAWAAAAAAWAAEAAEAAEAAWAARAAAQAAKAAEHAAQALDTTVGQLRLDYVATWTDEQLAQASGDWIEAATAEIFERAAEATT